MSTLIIIGASGLVGSNLYRDLSKSWNLFGVARTKPTWWNRSHGFLEGDVFAPFFPWDKVILKNAPILFLAFPTKVDEVEEWSNESRGVFLDSFAAGVKAAANANIPFFFVSSDAVLWGVPENVRNPVQPPIAINAYGNLKLDCERIVRNHQSVIGTCILRCTPVGFHPFVSGHGLLSLMLERAKREKISGFTNSVITPVHTSDFSKFVSAWHKALLNGQEIPSIIHLGTKGAISKYHLICSALKPFGLSQMVSPATFDSALFRAPRVADQSFLTSELSWFPNLDSQDLLSSLEKGA